MSPMTCSKIEIHIECVSDLFLWLATPMRMKLAVSLSDNLSPHFFNGSWIMLVPSQSRRIVRSGFCVVR
jgi:hypothetical protein